MENYYRYSVIDTVGAGTSEVQRNIIARPAASASPSRTDAIGARRLRGKPHLVSDVHELLLVRRTSGDEIVAVRRIGHPRAMVDAVRDTTCRASPDPTAVEDLRIGLLLVEGEHELLRGLPTLRAPET